MTVTSVKSSYTLNFNVENLKKFIFYKNVHILYTIKRLSLHQTAAIFFIEIESAK